MNDRIRMEVRNPQRQLSEDPSRDLLLHRYRKRLINRPPGTQFHHNHNRIVPLVGIDIDDFVDGADGGMIEFLEDGHFGSNEIEVVESLFVEGESMSGRKSSGWS